MTDSPPPQDAAEELRKLAARMSRETAELAVTAPDAKTRALLEGVSRDTKAIAEGRSVPGSASPRSSWEEEVAQIAEQNASIARAQEKARQLGREFDAVKSMDRHWLWGRRWILGNQVLTKLVRTILIAGLAIVVAVVGHKLGLF